MFFALEHRTATDSIVHRAHQARGMSMELPSPCSEHFGAMRHCVIGLSWENGIAKKVRFTGWSGVPAAKTAFFCAFFRKMCSLLMFFALPCFCMDFEVMKYPHFVTTIVSTKFSHFPVHRRCSEYSQALSLLAMSLGQGWLTAPFWLKHSASIASMAKRQDQAWQMLLWQHKIWLQSEWPPTTRTSRTFDHCFQTCEVDYWYYWNSLADSLHLFELLDTDLLLFVPSTHIAPPKC